MKKFLIILNIVALAVLCLVCCTACNSQDDPLDTVWTGTYHGAGGWVTFSSTQVSGAQLHIDCKVNGEDRGMEYVSFAPTYFDYEKDKSYSFHSNDVEILNSNIVHGSADFDGRHTGKNEINFGCPDKTHLVLKK